MNRQLAAVLILALSSGCASYNAYQKARTAEVSKDWDAAVAQYEKALAIDPGNTRYKVALLRAKREASREHFEKGKSLRAAAATSRGDDQVRLAQLAATELELTVRLDPTNQFAAVELGKAIQILQEVARAADPTIDDIKKRAKITKAQPPALNPASDEPISLSFPRETPVKDIYRALGNAFGINILFDQAVKDDRIAIELRDVTAQQALERVMQAANHFYKVLDERTIIVVPDNPQARRDYEDLVIRTFYLSNGDAEQVTNVVRTMIEARNVFPLKALNAITIRDTADKVRIAEKIIEANDKAKAEVVVAVELVQLDLTRLRDIGLSIQAGGGIVPFQGVGEDGARTPFTAGTIGEIAAVIGSANDIRRNVSFAVPTATYSLMKSLGNSDLLANPELRISEGEKATLHIGQRIPVPVTTFTTAVQQGQVGSLPATSFQYQDVGIKVSMEPRVHHNREVTLKLTVEVSNQGESVRFAGQEQPTFSTRTIESTIRLKDGETNFLAGLIQQVETNSDSKTPFLGDIPIIGRLFTESSKDFRRTDLVLTMTPHIIRIPDITEDDLAPMWVGTTNNLTFRGVSPRLESQSGVDPFTTPTQAVPRTTDQFGTNPAAFTVPAAAAPTGAGTPASGSGPSNPFNRPAPVTPAVPPPPPPPTTQPQSRLQEEGAPQTASLALPPAVVVVEKEVAAPAATETADVGASFSPLQDGVEPVPTSEELALDPRIAPQPSRLVLKPGEMKMWSIVGMDLDGLTTDEVLLRYDARSLNVTEVMFGAALETDPQALPATTIDPARGTIRIASTDGSPLRFRAGGEIFILRVFGGTPGETFLVVESSTLKSSTGQSLISAISGGRARVE